MRHSTVSTRWSIRAALAALTFVAIAAATVVTSTPAGLSADSADRTTQPTAQPGVVSRTDTLTVDGVRRSYLLVTPAAQAAPLPILVVLHGNNEPPAAELQRDELEPLVAAGKAILLYPAGYHLSWNAGADNCCGKAGTSQTDDLAFLAQLTTRATAMLSVQPGAVYLVGFSNGGKLAYQVMCREPQLFDAFAVVAATPLEACAAQPQPPRSVLIAVGGDDPELPISGHAVPATQALDAAATVWRQRDGCSAASTGTTIGSATMTTWSQCADQTQVRTVRYAGLGHAWPRSNTVGATASGATLIWQFLSAQRRS